MTEEQQEFIDFFKSLERGDMFVVNEGEFSQHRNVAYMWVRYDGERHAGELEVTCTVVKIGFYNMQEFPYWFAPSRDTIIGRI